jgi:acyl-CoA thioesterase-1
MIHLYPLMALVSAIAVAAVPRGAAPDASRPRIVALGDSLTSGRGIGSALAFPALLQQRVDDAGLEYQMVNAGVSGDTSAGAVRRLERALDGNVRVLIIALGANDGLRGVPVARLTENLSHIIEVAQARDISVLLCGMEALPIHGWDYSVAFHNAYRDLATRYQVTLVPFILRNVIGNPELMQPDRAHPNAEGARRIADNIWPYLKPLLEQAPAHHHHG